MCRLKLLCRHYRSRVSHELEIYVLKSLRDLFFLALEFFVENTMGQVISTVEHNRIPLRDLAFESLVQFNARHIAYLTPHIQVEEFAALWVLFCFSHGSVGLGVVQKGARCLTIARFLRMCLYSMTVLPSPKSWCRFTDPVDPFQIRVGGACNDLLYSGHVTIYTLTAIAITILSRRSSWKICRYILPLSIWFHVLQVILAAILERHHYSIDMFLGFIVILLMWQCQPLYVDLPRVPTPLSRHLKQLVCPLPARSILKEV